jgi:hypothetical protein
VLPQSAHVFRSRRIPTTKTTAANMSPPMIKNTIVSLSITDRPDQKSTYSELPA